MTRDWQAIFDELDDDNDPARLIANTPEWVEHRSRLPAPRFEEIDGEMRPVVAGALHAGSPAASGGYGHGFTTVTSTVTQEEIEDMIATVFERNRDFRADQTELEPDDEDPPTGATGWRTLVKEHIDWADRFLNAAPPTRINPRILGTRTDHIIFDDIHDIIDDPTD